MDRISTKQLAMLPIEFKLNGKTVEWMEKLSDEEYQAANRTA